MVKKRKGYTVDRMRGLRNTKTVSSTPPKKKSKAKEVMRLSPCMASTAGNLTIGGLTGKRNRRSMRPELERYVRRTRQRDRIVSAIRETSENNTKTMQIVGNIKGERPRNQSVHLTLTRDHQFVVAH